MRTGVERSGMERELTKFRRRSHQDRKPAFCKEHHLVRPCKNNRDQSHCMLHRTDTFPFAFHSRGCDRDSKRRLFIFFFEKGPP